MAVQTEDHPLEYAGFEGVIPKGEYGAARVRRLGPRLLAADRRRARGLAKGKLDFTLAGEKLRGRWHLVRMRPRAIGARQGGWLLIKGGTRRRAPRARLGRRDRDRIAC
jgi:bifunctional non-homologous end joining protein LigD